MKAQERANKTWAELQKEKETLAAEQAKLAAERAQFDEQRKKSLEEIAQAAEQSKRFTPDDYERVAKEFEAEGDDANAKRAMAEAARLRELQSQAQEQHGVSRVTKAWQENLAKMVNDHPELKNPQSELYKAVDEILKTRPVLSTYAGGIVDAVAVAQVSLKAQQANALEQQVKELNEKLQAYEQKLQPAGGTAAPRLDAKAFTQMSGDQQRAEILRLLREFDTTGKISTATIN